MAWFRRRKSPEQRRELRKTAARYANKADIQRIEVEKLRKGANTLAKKIDGFEIIWKAELGGTHVFKRTKNVASREHQALLDFYEVILRREQAAWLEHYAAVVESYSGMQARNAGDKSTIKRWKNFISEIKTRRSAKRLEAFKKRFAKYYRLSVTVMK
jgi:hypothetical protein